jgi:hypothetical protein
VPKTAPSAPSARAAARPRPSAKPPAATIGKLPIASRTSGISATEVDAAHVSSGLEALRHDRIDARVLRRACFVGRAALPHNLDAGFLSEANRIDMIAGIAPEKRQHLDRGLNDCLNDAGADKRDEQVGRERLGGLTARRRHLIEDAFWAKGYESDGAEAARLGDGCRQISERDCAHTGCDDRIFDIKEVADLGFQTHDRYIA